MGTAFDLWWALYPRKERKALAREAWYEVTKGWKERDFDILMERTRQYRRDTADTETRYLTTPDRWLLDRRWEDERTRPRLTVEERMTQRGPGIYYQGRDL